MPNIPVISARKLIKVLQKKGFVLHRVSGSHHVFIRKTDQLSVSVPVHAGHDLGRGITRSILKDAEITQEEFLRFL
ncbi:type II toxin-antitoxin system HicA family toxin [Candidatus Gottesmanbacteria bacterium]|nr:type II toxin-antitoxin system HicA family toxin [Candidatus Gottesmanbacteria bacterium]